MNNENGKFQGWIANLSDGSQRFEQPDVPGEKTAWQKLLDLVVEDNGIKMTGLQLRRGDTRINTLPHKQCDGYIHVYEVRERFFGSMGENPIPAKLLQGVGSIIGENVYITWIELDSNPANIYQDVRSLESSLPHTTLREAHDDVQSGRNT